MSTQPTETTMDVFKPPHRPATRRKRLFLAGSIDMGAAVDWQAKVEQRLSDLEVEIFNPRRQDWDSSWVQEIENAPFREQVEWELEFLEQADVIAFYFDPGGKAPITLLELGLYANSGNAVVFCPRGYWRSGNIQVVCNRYRIPLIEDDFDAFVTALRDRLKP